MFYINNYASIAMGPNTEYNSFFIKEDSGDWVELLANFRAYNTGTEIVMYNIFGDKRENPYVLGSNMVLAPYNNWTIDGITYSSPGEVVDALNAIICATPKVVVEQTTAAALTASLEQIHITSSHSGAPDPAWRGKTVVFHANSVITPDNVGTANDFAFRGLVMSDATVTWGTPVNDAAYLYGAPPVCTEKRSFYFSKELDTNNFVILQ